MSENRSVLDAPIDKVWAVLADPTTYARWVVGAKEVRDVEGVWPEVGSKLHHSVGVGPVKIKDNTAVQEMRPLEYLQLRARVRPVGLGNIAFELHAQGDQTEVIMREVVNGGPAAAVYGRVMDLLIKARNVEALRRLENEAQKR